WLALDAFGAAKLWRVDDASATITTGPTITGFPDDEPTWIRRLVFLGQSPHLVAVPRASKVGELDLHVAAITPSLGLAQTWSLSAIVECPPLSELSCPLFWDDVRDVAVLDVAEPGSIAGAALLLAITSPVEVDMDPETPPTFETNIISLVLQRDAADE